MTGAGSGSTEDVVRVLIVDDHKIMRDGLAALLGAIRGMEVVGSASDGVEAISAVRSLSPDVVVMDISMPHLTGIDATRRIRADHPDVRVLMLTMNEDLQTIRAALGAGACGYLLKGAGAEEVEQAIRLAARGGMVFSADIGAAVADIVTGRESPAPLPFPELTQRERSVLELIASGRSNAEIAASTYLSDKSVRNLVSGLYAKLGVTARADAMIMAREAGLGRAG